MKAYWTHRRLIFKSPAGTSRGTLLHKDTWYLVLDDSGYTAIGEAGMFRGLSCDDVPHYEEELEALCSRINSGSIPSPSEYESYPSIRFALEVALGKMEAMKEGKCYMDSPWVRGKEGIAVNGLIWMGSHDNMVEQIKTKLNAGYTCLKMKIGAIAWEEELSIIKALRSEFTSSMLTLRVDANGAFTPSSAPAILDTLARYEVHSIEQPIRAGQVEEMARLCETTPTPIALDEELIGIREPLTLLDTIRPQYIILKPTLLGGFNASREWISAARKHEIGYWVTSALESNVGLDAIARFTYIEGDINFPQGLGTGMLYHNNIPYPFEIRDARFYMNGTPHSDKELYHLITEK